MTALVVFAAICVTTSCKKEKSQPTPVLTRTIRFILYTNQDFSNDNHNISFALHIRNTNQTISFDSTVFSMKVKDIPNKQNQLVFEKKVPSDGSILTAGFLYSIENVGNSWHLDTCAANEKFKIIEYPFE
jgi:hypothetical protein